MKNFATAVLVLFIFLLTTQLVHHTYDRIFTGSASVLDKYNKKGADIEIDSSLSLKELSMIYADAEKRIRVLESGKAKTKLAQYDNSDDPYQKKIRIKEIIISRESAHKMIIEIVIFWIIGLLLIAGGSFVYIKFEPWIGASLVTAGFSQMVMKTGPMFFLAENPVSPMILNIKIIFTAITLAAVIASWIYGRKYIK